MSRFHRYSANNSLLIAMQMPNATAVASYTDWKRKFGRQVRKGECGIRILAPARYRRKVEDEDGDEAVVERLACFRLAGTFDVSQTDGEPLPQIAELLDGSVERYGQVMGAIEEAAPAPVGFEEMPASVNGFFSRAERRIAIRPGMSQAQTVKTAIHELAHSRMHDFDGATSPEDPPDRGTREVQAESVAFVVARHYGLDTGSYNFGYVASWASGRELEELKASMGAIPEVSPPIAKASSAWQPPTLSTSARAVSRSGSPS